ncbi:glutathione S-transferase 2-like [Melitaea cinxia]|uniref:glutathione S-transferase 2-like n=1 Tax=Melitaea cinxia TaxID=113334 RepID=UPI001E26FDFB|nr:glutathione S-transferase 2-like [Melitaea cinxia]
MLTIYDKSRFCREDSEETIYIYRYIVVHYFTTKALSESIRLLLAYGGLEFEDHRVEEEDWEAFKPSNNALRVLEIDGKKYAQSVAIARYLGKKFKINGANIEEEFEIDQNVDYPNSIDEMVNIYVTS